MNQILYTENTKKKGGSLEIKTVLKLFAFACIIFGIVLIFISVMNLLNREETSSSIPVVEVEQLGEKLNIKVTHNKLIDRIEYSWDDEEKITLQGKGRREIAETIDMPVGTSTLVLNVIDINGNTVSYSEVYEVEEIDTENPEIELLVEDQKVKIVAKDDTELDYISYYWNEEDETKVTARQNSLKQIEEKIDILKGENTLTVIAVDKVGNESQKEQTYKGATKPKIEATAQGNVLQIKVSDEEEIQKIDIEQNDILYSTDAEGAGTTLGTKSVEFTQPLSNGINKIKITAYNISGLYSEFTTEVTI